MEKKEKTAGRRALADKVVEDLAEEEQYAAKEAPKGPEAAAPRDFNKWLALAGIALVVIVFLALTVGKGASAFEVDGIKFYSQAAPEDALKKVLAAEKPVLTAVQPEGETACVYGMLIQLSAGLGASNKKPLIQVRTGDKCTGFDSTVPSNCIEGGIVIRKGECNCVKMTEKEMVVEGSDAFLCNNSVKISDFVAFSMTGRHLDLTAANEVLRKYQEEQANKTFDNVTGDIEADAVNESVLETPLLAGNAT